MFIKKDVAPHPAVIRLALERYGEDPAVLEVCASVFLRQQKFDAVDDMATKLMIGGHKPGYRLKAAVLEHRKKPDMAYHMYMEAGDDASVLDAARMAIAAGWPDRALTLLDNAHVGAGHFKKYETLRRNALEIIEQQKLSGVVPKKTP